MIENEIEKHYMDAAWDAVGRFPVTVNDLTFVSRSENITFRVSVDDSEADYVLRLHRPGYCLIEELESERAWLGALKEEGNAVQTSLQTRAGGHFTLVDVPGEASCYAGMTTWTEGIPLRAFLETCSSSAERQEIFHGFGNMVAGFHNQSTSWDLPDDFRRRRLDLDALLGENPSWGRFWEHPSLSDSQQATLRRAREWGRSVLSNYETTADNFSLIHADFTPDNIIFGNGSLTVIDFDDAAFGWHMYDIASALVECQFDTDADELRQCLLNGYQQHRNLSDQDIAMISPFMLVRGMAVIGWFYQRPEHAESEYFERFVNWVLDQCALSGI